MSSKRGSAKVFDLLFIPIQKVDEENRLVYGEVASEVVDNSGEIFDYDGSKPFFEKWSDNAYNTSGGKSYGNIRVMHTSKAAGIVQQPLGFDDVNKTISACAEIVDDDEWKKVLKGVYTGFSMGGRYVERIKKGDEKRYVADPVEVSLVDKPCIPSATFDVVKADGVVEHVEFIVKADYADPENEKYPLDTEAHIRAAWSYINMPKNQKDYSDSKVSSIKAKIVAAWKSEIDKDGPPSAQKVDEGDLSKGTPVDDSSAAAARRADEPDATNRREDTGKFRNKTETEQHGGSDPTGHGASEATATTKSDAGDFQMRVPTNDEVLPHAQALAKAAGRDADWMEFMTEASERMQKGEYGGAWAQSTTAPHVIVDPKAKVKGVEGHDDHDNPGETRATGAGGAPEIEEGISSATGKNKDDTSGNPAARKGDVPAFVKDKIDAKKEGDDKDDEDADKAKKADAADHEEGCVCVKCSPEENAEKADTLRQLWTTSDGRGYVKKADALSHEEVLAKAASPETLTSLLKAASAAVGDLGKADDAGDTVPADDAKPESDAQKFGKSVKADIDRLRGFADNTLVKGLYTLSRLATLVECLEGIFCSVKWEEEYEGDGSTVPATMFTSLKTLGAALVAMADEEVKEMLAVHSGDADAGVELLELAAGTLGLEKADLQTNLQKRMGSVQPTGDTVSKADFDVVVAKAARLEVELGEAMPLVKSLIADVERIKATPMPMRRPGVVVEKADGAPGGNSGPENLLEKYTADQLTDAAIRIGLAHGRPFVPSSSVGRG